MEVRLYPNSMRPGVGLKPRREGQRPLLPQHARHCPVLEAGSALGYLVFPPLESRESYYVSYEGDGQYKFVYYVQGTRSGKFDPIFTVTLSMPVGGVGMIKEDVQMVPGVPTISREQALKVMRVFLVPEDMGTPPGALALRAATNFQTSAGWDTVYAPIFNMIERPVAPMLVVRVETDWHSHETEFRYVLQPGEGISGSHTMPIGQVFFMPREDVIMREATDAEFAEFLQYQRDFVQKKAGVQQTTSYGLTFSPYYLRESRARKDAAKAAAGGGAAAPAGEPVANDEPADSDATT
jgi:hypothetical protein